MNQHQPMNYPYVLEVNMRHGELHVRAMMDELNILTDLIPFSNFRFQFPLELKQAIERNLNVGQTPISNFEALLSHMRLPSHPNNWRNMVHMYPPSPAHPVIQAQRIFPEGVLYLVKSLEMSVPATHGYLIPSSEMNGEFIQAVLSYYNVFLQQ